MAPADEVSCAEGVACGEATSSSSQEEVIMGLWVEDGAEKRVQVPMAGIVEHIARHALGLVLCVFTFLMGWRMVAPGEQVVVLCFGKLWMVLKEPGMYFVVPWGCSFQLIRTRPTILEIQRCVAYSEGSKEQMLAITANITWRVTDAEAAHFTVDSPQAVMRSHAQTVLNTAINNCHYDHAGFAEPGVVATFKHNSEEIGRILCDMLHKRVIPAGLEVSAFDVSAVVGIIRQESCRNEIKVYSREAPMDTPSQKAAPATVGNPLKLGRPGPPQTYRCMRAVGSIAVTKFGFWNESSEESPWVGCEKRTSELLQVVKQCTDETSGELSSVMGMTAVCTWGLHRKHPQSSSKALRALVLLRKRIVGGEGFTVTRDNVQQLQRLQCPFHAGMATGPLACGNVTASTMRGFLPIMGPTVDLAYSLMHAAAEYNTAALTACATDLFNELHEHHIKQYIRPVAAWSFRESQPRALAMELARGGPGQSHIREPKLSELFDDEQSLGIFTGTQTVGSRVVIVFEVHLPALLFASHTPELFDGAQGAHVGLLPPAWRQEYHTAFYKSDIAAMSKFCEDPVVAMVVRNFVHDRHCSHAAMFLHPRAGFAVPLDCSGQE